MRLRILRKLRILRLPLTILCDSVLGQGHSHRHRMVMGSAVMAAGYVVSHTLHFELSLINAVCEIGGSTIHAIGAVPFVELLTVVATTSRTS